jgi:hypothetical protein
MAWIAQAIDIVVFGRTTGVVGSSLCLCRFV